MSDNRGPSYILMLDCVLTMLSGCDFPSTTTLVSFMIFGGSWVADGSPCMARASEFDKLEGSFEK
jgi:hypothetical protein